MSRKIKVRLFLLSFIGFASLVMMLTTGQPAFAHERWFVQNPNSYPIKWELLLTWPVLLVIFAGIAITIITAIVDQRYRTWRRAKNPDLTNQLAGINEERLRRIYAYLPLLLSIHVAIPLLVSGFQLQLFAPNLQMEQNLLSGLLALAQALIALALVYGVFTRFAAAALIALFGAALVLSPFLPLPTLLLAEQVYIVGIGVFFLIIGRGRFSGDALLGRRNIPDPRLVIYAIPALRWGVGGSIVVLAFTEKLLNPALAQAFLIQKINFNLGSDFGITNDGFIILAGFVEFTFGLLLISGVLPRLVIIGLWIPFNLTLPYLGWVELAGHLPIYAVMLLLLVVGPSSHRAALQSARALAEEAAITDDLPLNPATLPEVPAVKAGATANLVVEQSS